METATQVVLIIMILLLGSTLSAVGIMFFFVLKDMRISVQKVNTILDDVKLASDNITSSSELVKETVSDLHNSIKFIHNELSSPVSIMFNVMRGFRSMFDSKGGEDDE
ncbi:hypothetical protein HGA91_04630 [candidate division WWE3 bacterium]|nr:hypothetical protein [candidate division WWE3 bacterium]